MWLALAECLIPDGRKPSTAINMPRVTIAISGGLPK